MQQTLAITHEYLNALCELKTLSNDLLTTGKIRKIGPDFLEISNAMGSSSLRMFVDEVKVIITHRNLPPLVFTGNLYIPTMEFFRVIDVKSVMKEELRSFFRVNVYLPMTLVAPNEDKESKDLYDYHEATMVDLSLGGAYFKTKASIFEDTNIKILIEFRGKSVVLEAKIIRKHVLANQTFGYACIFDKMKGMTADVVCQYLFQVQKEIRI